MKEVQMTFRVEPELRDRFTATAEREHRPASQVLRELMRGYVERGSRSDDVIPRVTLDPAERRRRQDAANFARANVGLEGFRLSAEDEARTRRFIDGEIELADFLKDE